MMNVNLIYQRLKYLIMRLLSSLKNDSFIETFKKINKTLSKKNKINLDEIFEKFSNENLEDLFLRFGTDKGKYDGKKTYDLMQKDLNFKKKFKDYKSWILRSKIQEFDYQLGLNFTPVYEKYFKSIKNEKLNILEIGVANGHSSAAFLIFFPNSFIYGMDMKDEYKLFYNSKRYSYNKIDIFSEKKINQFKKKQIEFDIIIDDSLHDQQGITTNLKNFYPMLKPNGFYVIEDFKLDDLIIKGTRDFNIKNGKKFQFYTQFTCEEIFEKINKKIYFDHSILDSDFQKIIYSFNNKVSVHFNDHPFSSICVINKNA